MPTFYVFLYHNKKIIFIWSKESKRKLEAMGVARVVAGDIEKEGQRDIPLTT